MENLYGTGLADGYESWTNDERFSAIIGDLDAFYRTHQRGYAEQCPADTAELRMAGWEPTVWYKNPYLLDAVAQIEEQINDGSDAAVEIGGADSLTGNPIIESFSRESFGWALVEVAQ